MQIRQTTALILGFVLLTASLASAQGRKFTRDFSKTEKVEVLFETSEGPIRAELFFAKAPNTVASFMHLSDSGFYNGLSFHRIIQGFVAQGGDPNGDGTGGPGYTIDDEISELKHEAGVLSMANAGPNTGGSQFFFTHMPQPHLDGKHTVFGRILTGFDNMTRLEPGDKIEKVTVKEFLKK